MNIGLFFGSFNPVHIGHLAIANYMAEYTNLEQIWFVVSPHNPLKQKSTLLADYHRLELLHRAIADDPRFKVSNVEFRMPQPSYTIDTLAVLTEKYPAHTFAIIMGSDGLATFDKWKNAGQIESRFQRYVYPRPGFPESIFVAHKNCTWVNAPQMDISSSFVREGLSGGKDLRHFCILPCGNMLMK